jgi:hypothetical protein
VLVPHVSDRGREEVPRLNAQAQEETPFGECEKAFRADRAERGGSGLLGKVGRLGRAVPVPREGFKMEIDFEFQMNLDFGKTLRNFTRRFRRNLDMIIFPEFF